MDEDERYIELNFGTPSHTDRSNGSITALDQTSGSGSAKQSSHLDEDEQRERRTSIRAILADRSLSELDRRKSIQSLMDGRSNRNRGSFVSLASSKPNSRRGSRRASSGNIGAEATISPTVSRTGRNSLISRSNLVLLSEDNALSSIGDDETYGNNSSSTVDDILIASTMRKLNRRELVGRMSDLTNDDNFGNNNTAPTHNMNSPTNQNLGFGGAVCQPCSLNKPYHPLSMEMEKNRPKCTHYDRKCTIIAPCCKLAFGCRLCHDDQQEDGQYDDAAKMGEASLMDNEPHKIDRHAVEEIICRNCYTRQSSKTYVNFAVVFFRSPLLKQLFVWHNFLILLFFCLSCCQIRNNCINCDTRFGEYHCAICNLWMPEASKPYHCKDCGFCRVGGRDKFKHCDKCGMCIDSKLFEDHNCDAGRYRSDCPVCQEDLFSSRLASHEMPCGHVIHWHCFKELISYDSRCPVCKKTCDSHENMMSTWQSMATSIAIQPIPSEMAKLVTITCNDCESKEVNRWWHFIGIQCNSCKSFNTSVDSVQFTGKEAIEYMSNL